MSFAPAGTWTRRQEQRALEDTITRQRVCPHAHDRGDGGPDRTVYHYVCTDCGVIVRSYLRERGRWVLVHDLRSEQRG